MLACQTLQNFLGEADARSSSSRCVGICNRRIHARRAEEIQQRRIYPRYISRPNAAAAHRERTAEILTGRKCRQEVRGKQVAANGVGIDRTIKMPAAIEVVRQAES